MKALFEAEYEALRRDVVDGVLTVFSSKGKT